MNYNPKWKRIEIEHDEKFPIKPKNNIKPTLRGLSLLDCKILQNWFSYAKGIGDQSLDLKDENILINTADLTVKIIDFGCAFCNMRNLFGGFLQ